MNILYKLTAIAVSLYKIFGTKVVVFCAVGEAAIGFHLRAGLVKRGEFIYAKSVSVEKF